MEILKAAGYWRIPIFMKEFLGDYASAPFGRHHHEIFDGIPRGARGRYVNVLAPRGSGKSVTMAVIYPLHRICYRAYDELMGFEPDPFILIISKSYQMAASRVVSIKQELELNEVLREAFGNLVGKEYWGERRLLTVNGVQVVPLGRGGQIRGSLVRHVRPSLIISDDLDDPETVENPEVREKDRKWFDTDLIRAGALDGSTNFINIDTVKHEEATASVLRDRAGWRTLFYRAIEKPADLWHPTAEGLWKEWEKLFTDFTVSDEERVARADGFFEEHRDRLMAGVEHLWEEVIDYKKVREEICDVGYWAVLRELQNSTRDPSRAIFDMDAAMKFSVTEEGLMRKDQRCVQWNQIAGGSVFLDWAGGKDSVDNAFAAAVCVLWEPMPGRRENISSLSGCHAYVWGVWLDKVKLSIQIEQALELMMEAQGALAARGVTDLRWRFSVEDFIESAAAIKEYVRVTFQAIEEKLETGVRLEFTRRFTNKVERIAALEPAVTHGWLGFHERLPGEYMKQMSLFPTADFMDGPDATEGACQLRVTEFPSERQRARERRPRDIRVRL